MAQGQGRANGVASVGAATSWLAAGLVIGAALGANFARRREGHQPVPPVDSSSDRREVHSPESRCSAPGSNAREPDCCDDLRQCRASLELASEVLRGLDSRPASLTIPVPDHLAERQQPAVVGELLARWARACGLHSASIVEVDCAEYPCIGAVLTSGMADAQGVVDCQEYDGHMFAPAAWLSMPEVSGEPAGVIQVLGVLDSEAMFLENGSRSTMLRVGERAEAMARELEDSLIDEQ